MDANNNTGPWASVRAVARCGHALSPSFLPGGMPGQRSLTKRLAALVPAMMLVIVAASFRPAAAAEPEPSSPSDVSAPLEQEDAIALMELDIPVVVTAARHEQKLSHVAYAMSVITAEDIRESGARTIADALRLVPGVDVADLSYGQTAVSPRGFHGFLANKTLVLVDGRQIYDSLFGGTLWQSWPFQLEDIERIEVIRGPGGVTWGANAVNGVINIITKDPDDQIGASLSLRGGSRGAFRQRLAYGAHAGAWRYRFSAEYESSDGFREGGSLLGRLDDDYKA
ncbi:MAG: ligand-gated channel protein, partial [Planctomycetota bacterium]